LVCLIACDQVPPSPTPTRGISAPTLEASRVILPVIPTLSALEPGQSDLTAASLPRGAALPPFSQETRAPGAISLNIVITLANGTQHPGVLYTPAEGGIAPGVMLITPNGDSDMPVGDVVLAWGDLPRLLRDAGMTALVTTLPAGITIADFEVLLTSLGETSDPGHLAVVGLDAGADGALAGCSAVTLCDAVALIRPTSPTLINAMPGLNPRPLWIAATTEDANAYVLAEALIEAGRGEKQLLSITGETLDFAGQQALVAWLIAQLG